MTVTAACLLASSPEVSSAVARGEAEPQYDIDMASGVGRVVDAQACSGRDPQALDDIACEGAGVFVIDVGQGAALWVRGRDGTNWMIDGGDAAAAESVRAVLERHKVRAVDLWALTHYDADHIGAFALVLAGRDGVARTHDDLQVERVWDRGDLATPNSGTFSTYLDALLTAGAPRREVASGDEVRAPGMQMRVVGRGPTHASRGENDRSLALCIDVEGLRVFVGGDLPAEAALGAARRCSKVDLWVANHHGASDGVSPELVEVLDPKWTFVSAGLDNAHCHPSQRMIDLLRTRAVWISGGAGRASAGACAPMAAHLGAGHHWASSGLRWMLGADGP